MSTPQFHVTWKEHLKNVGYGFSALQQNNEFVDMTLAADGHFVKVHQIIMAVTSPYIKDLIASADCKHPVIFLNKISYKTLSAILEYIYTGEVLVAVDCLKDFLDAAKELHIRGLQDMSLPGLISGGGVKKENTFQTENNGTEIIETENLDSIHQDDTFDDGDEPMDSTIDGGIQSSNDMDESFDIEDSRVGTIKISKSKELPNKTSDGSSVSALQYTVSNQGSLQMILNRFVYYLKYTDRHKTRQWRCVDYINKYKCPAFVITKDDVVLQRVSAHSHPFHDKKILKKLRNGTIFSAINEAETEGNIKKSKNKDNEEEK